MKQVINEIGDRARNFYSSSENVTNVMVVVFNSCIVSVRFQWSSVDMVTELRVTNVDTWSKCMKNCNNV